METDEIQEVVMAMKEDGSLITSLKSIQTMQWVQTGVTALALFLGGTLYIKSQSAAADDWAPTAKEGTGLHGDSDTDNFIMDQYLKYLATR